MQYPTPAPLPNAPATPPIPAPDNAGCLRVGIFILLGAWMVGLTVLIQFSLWAAVDIAMAESAPLPALVPAIASLAHMIGLALPTVPMALFLKPGRLRDASRAWAGSAVFVGLAGLARLWPKTATQPAALTLIALCVALLALLLLIRRKASLQAPAAAIVLAAALGGLAAWAWPRWGALGSALDTLLALIAGSVVALVASAWIDRTLYAAVTERSPVTAQNLAFEGAVIGVALMAIGSGAGFDGAQILLMLPLWAIGVAAAGLYRLGGVAAMAAFVAPVIALPMAFVDPDELTLLLGGHDVLSFMPAAVAMATLSGLTLSALLLLARRRLAPPRRALAAVVTGIAALALIGVYALAGKPGLYGERLFVILKDQADLRPTAAITDRDTRMKAVHDTLVSQANRTQAPLRRTLSQLGVTHTPYYLVNAIEVDGGLPMKAFLLAQPEVARIIDSPRLRPLPQSAPIESGDEPAPLIPQWNLTSIGAERVWKELRVTGAGIVVGQSDSGVDGGHPALAGAYRGRGGRDDYNWLDPWNRSRSPVDIGGHGTHTLGSIVGRADGRIAPTGVAPEAEWFGCVNLARNLANPALYLDCLQFMLAPWPQAGDPLKDGNPKLGAHVINNSWGCPPLEGCDPQALEPAVDALRAAGVFVVASAGNEGPRCETIKDPISLYDASFSVAAVDSKGEIAEFSSRGPVSVDGSGRVKPDIAAPGVGVLSTLPGGTYGSNSGTSMAGPHIAGVVALMWSAQPKLIGNIDATERILRETARPAGASAPKCGGSTANVFGAGIVDAYAAVKAAQAFK
jgi:hypothetical protein